MLSFHTARQMAYIKTLIDSGATENFISPEVITRLGIKTRSLPVPVDLKTVDGSTHKEGKITEYCWLKVTHGDKQYKDVFFVASLGKDRLILGYPFLYHFQPRHRLAEETSWGRESPYLQHMGRTTGSTSRATPSQSNQGSRDARPRRSDICQKNKLRTAMGPSA
jgi:hypothetical protein